MDLLGLFGALLRQSFTDTPQAFVPSVELYLQVFSILVETAEQNRAAELCRTNARIRNIVPSEELRFPQRMANDYTGKSNARPKL